MPQGRQRYYQPVIYFENNLIITKGKKDLTNISGKECWALYKWQGFNYDFLNSDGKIERLLKNTRAFTQVFSEAHLLQIPLKNKISDNMNYLRSIVSGPMKASAIQYIDSAEEVLSESDIKESDYETFLILKLKKPRTLKDYKDVLISLVRDPIREINELLALDVAEIYENEIEAFKWLEQSLRRGLKKYINIKELNEVDIEKNIRSPFRRGLSAPKLRGKEAYFEPIKGEFKKATPWRPTASIIQTEDETIIRPLKRDILTLNEGLVDIYPKHIEIEQQEKGESKTSFQKFIVVSSLPDIEFPCGLEWIYRLKDLDFPVWPSIRFIKKDYEEVSKKINESRKELDDQLVHNKEAGAKTAEVYYEQDEAIDRAKYAVEKEKKPFLYTTVVIGVAADTLNECNERAKAVQDYFDEMDIETQIPTGDQWKLFNETLIGSQQYAMDYILRIPPETLAGSMVGASTMIGDPLGLPIGTTGMNGKLVKFDPFRASQINESPAISFTGTLGRGKSLLANLIALLAAFLGAKVLINDPKGERGDWAKVLPQIKPYLNIITLSPSKENTGKLDIFQIMLRSVGKKATKVEKKDITKQAAEYALSILGTLAGYKTTDERMEYLADAVNIAAQEENPCNMKVIKALEKLADKADNDVEKAKYIRIRDTLKNRINNTAYAHLLFGTGTEDVIDITKPINIIQTQNLTIPEEGKAEEDFTFQERVGMATLICISALGMEFALQSREFLKIYMQDESSVFKRSTQGKAMHNRMVKMGRTENAPIYLIGQNVSDIGDTEDVRANIGTRFAFGTKTLGEAQEILKYMGLNEESRELQEMLVDLPTGVCLMRDVEGRISMVGIDPIFEDLLNAFNTKPEYKRDDTVDAAPNVEEENEVVIPDKDTTVMKEDLDIGEGEEQEDGKGDREADNKGRIKTFLESWGEDENE